MPNYNYIAWIYDFLSKLVFGNKQEFANRLFLEEIPQNAQVLVVGGGTGKIIEELNGLEKNLTVDYVDSSSRMMAISKKRDFRMLDLQFHHQSILNYSGSDYDIIITNFFFDQFNQKTGKKIAGHLQRKLKESGFIIFSDFMEATNLWDKFISFATILFLRITANLKIRSLPDYEELFRFARLRQDRAIKTGRNIITSILYPI